MPWSGGVYTLPVSSWYPAVVDTEIDPDDSNSTLADIATGISATMPRDGSAPATGNWPMGSHKLTGLAAGTSAGDSVRYEQVIGAYQPLDATLTAIAALAWVSGSSLLQFTAADTVSLTNTPLVTTIDVGATDTTVSRSAAGVLAVEGGVIPKENRTNTFSAANNRFIAGDENNTLYVGSAHDGVDEIAGEVAFRALDFAANETIYHKIRSRIGDPTNGSEDGILDFYQMIAGVETLVAEIASGGAISFVFPVTSRIPLSTETTGTLTNASANKKVNCSGGITLDDGVFATDDTIIFDAGASARTFTRAAGLTMYVNGTDSASATLAANQGGCAIWRSSTVVVLAGAFS